MVLSERWVPPRVIDGVVQDAFRSLSRFINAKVFARSGTGMVGGTPPEAHKGMFLVIAGREQITTDGSGQAIVTFPQPFPNGVITVVACSGSTGGQVVNATTGLSLATFGVTGTASATFNIRYIAIGW